MKENNSRDSFNSHRQSNKMSNTLGTQYSNSTGTSSSSSSSCSRIKIPDLTDFSPRILMSRQILIGRTRSFKNTTLLEYGLITNSIISIGTLLGFSIFLIFAASSFDSQENFLSFVYLLNLAISTYYLICGIFQEDPFKIIMLALSILLIWVLVILNYFTFSSLDEDETYLNGINLAKLLSMTALTWPNIGLALLVSRYYWLNDNFICKLVGNDILLTKMCRFLFCGLALLNFYSQIFSSCLIFYLIFPSEEGILTSYSIPFVLSGFIFTIIWTVVSQLSLKREKFSWTCGICVATLVQLGTIIFILVETSRLSHVVGFINLYLTGSIFFIAYFLFLGIAFKVVKNYGNGLKFKVCD